MIKDISFSSYIFPVRDGRVAVLKYGENGYGPIGGRLDDGENFIAALRRELDEELGASAAKMADVVVEIPVPYVFRHATPERAQKRGAWGEEHHFFIAHVPDDMEISFCENRPDQVSVIWLHPDKLLSPSITPLADMREFYAAHILPNIRCRFSMSLQHAFYDMVKSGAKDIELRLYDEKRRRMRNNDIVLIYDAQNPSDYGQWRVVRLHVAANFTELATKISIGRTGFECVSAMLSAVSKFYGPDAESAWGVVGVEIEPAE